MNKPSHHAPKELTQVRIPKVKFTKAGLVIAADTTFDEWELIGHALGEISGSIQWAIGDWLNFGEDKFGEKYAQALDATHYSFESLMNIKSVSKRVSISRRREAVAWSTHADVASLEPPDQEKLLDKAASGDLKRSEVRDLVAKKKDRPERELCPACGRPL